LKIAMIDPGNFSPVYDANLCHSLALRGHDVVLHTSEFLFEPVPPLPGYHTKEDFFPLVRHLKSLEKQRLSRRVVKATLYPFDLIRCAAQMIRAVPDIVHVQWSLVPLLDAFVYARLRRRGAGLVYTAHDLDPFSGSTWSSAGFERLYRIADAIIVHAEASRRRLIEDVGVNRRRVHVIPIGGPGAYAGAPLPRSDARRRLGLRSDAVYALFFGLIKEHKGLDVLLDAFALARDERPQLRLLIAGEPMISWRKYADRISRLELGPFIDLHLGFVPSDRVSLYFSAADLVVLPYGEIFQSGVAVAAFTYGRPVVATRVGGLPELVQDGVTGFLAPPSDPRGLAETLVDATGDSARLAAMADAAASAARGAHSWEHIAERHEQVYSETIRQSL
jgi:D-inositol-3-phosphate glycosyltransferase